jgi:hypothetical protein
MQLSSVLKRKGIEGSEVMEKEQQKLLTPDIPVGASEFERTYRKYKLS